MLAPSGGVALLSVTDCEGFGSASSLDCCGRPYSPITD